MDWATKHADRRAAREEGHPAWVVSRAYQDVGYAIRQMVANTPAHLDEIADQTGYSPETVRVTLVALERVGDVDREGDRWKGK